MKTPRDIGLSQSDRVFFIAEAGINHNGSVSNARKLIDLAHRAGADAVKFQKRNIRRILWSTDKNADITITRNGVVCWDLFGNGELDFHGFSDTEENDSDIVIDFNNGHGTVVVEVTKVSGYGPQDHQGADGDLG